MVEARVAFSVIVTGVFQRALTIADRTNSGDSPVETEAITLKRVRGGTFSRFAINNRYKHVEMQTLADTISEYPDIRLTRSVDSGRPNQRAVCSFKSRRASLPFRAKTP